MFQKVWKDAALGMKTNEQTCEECIYKNQMITNASKDNIENNEPYNEKKYIQAQDKNKEFPQVWRRLL